MVESSTRNIYNALFVDVDPVTVDPVSISTQLLQVSQIADVNACSDMVMKTIVFLILIYEISV